MSGFRYGWLALVLSVSSGCSARDVPAAWKPECVGRMQLSFPGNVDVAATTRSDLRKNWNPPSSSFIDGEYAGWSGLGYLGGIEIVHGLDPSEIDAFWVERTAIREKFRVLFTKAGVKSSDRYQELSTLPHSGLAFQAQDQRYLALQLGRYAFTWNGYSKISPQQAQADYDAVVAGLRARDLFSVPSEVGVCLPYAFIRDEGTARRYVAMTYRLRENPDVTVLLKDVKAAEADPKANPAVYDPESMSDSFWGRYDSTYRRSLRSEWYQPYKRITLGNSKGVESFVKIVREDGAVDYGYLVVARGDPNAKEDTPDLMLYVIQNSKNAKAKGIEPVSKEAFLEMAQTIAASVKRRPVTAQ